MASRSEAVQCMICMEYEPHLHKPKRLPCSHVLCKDCLLRLSEVSYESFSCPTCRSVAENTVDSLPSALPKASEKEPDIVNCHVCVKKKKKDMNLADMYCYNCNNAFCDNHAGSHIDIYPEHEVVEIALNWGKAKKFGRRTCKNHRNQELSLGCPECYAVFCLKCLPDNSWNCTGGEPHKFTDLGDLAYAFELELDELRARAKHREMEAKKLVIETTRALIDWDKATINLVDQLHKARDKQLKRIGDAYVRLEDEIYKHRDIGKKEMDIFLEQNASVRHFELERELHRNDVRVSNFHQVDFVENHKKILEHLGSLIAAPLPFLPPKEDLALIKAGNTIGADVELVMSHGGKLNTIDQACESKPFFTALPPMGLALINEVKTPLNCTAVCQWKGRIYFGQIGGSIESIDKQGLSKRKVFAKLNGTVTSLAIHKEKLYSVIYNATQSKIFVHDMNGIQLRQWNHPKLREFYGNIMAFLSSDRVAVGNWTQRQIIIYSLMGDVVKRVPCPPFLTTNGNVAMTSCKYDCVVISDRRAAKIIKMSLEDGKQLWCVSTDPDPCGMASINDHDLILAHSGQKTNLSIFDVETGLMVHQICDDKKMRNHSIICHMDYSGGTLVVPRYGDCAVLIYHLQRD